MMLQWLVLLVFHAYVKQQLLQFFVNYFVHLHHGHFAFVLSVSLMRCSAQWSLAHLAPHYHFKDHPHRRVIFEII